MNGEQPPHGADPDVAAPTFRNRVPAYLWAFAAAWWALLLAMTAALVRDGPPNGYSVPATVAFLGLFWAAGAVLAGFALNQPIHAVRVEPGVGLQVIRRYPFKTIRKTVPMSAAPEPEVVESKDSDGDAYFHARLTILPAMVVDIAESHRRADCERACRRLKQAMHAPPAARGGHR